MADPAFPVTVFHNPACGTSRKVLAAIETAGLKPEVVEYVKAGWTRDQLTALFAEMGVTPRDVMRRTGDLVSDLGLLEPSVSDATILDAMVAHPILVNRPIVRTPKGVKLCRPVETLLDLLPG
ncbi:arsenate reductase (glutaredoxin) [uncultured Brevundimonas sp.]|uniref:arsenate reductase (glutaredoxin) n=1 Tax=uncultured Brevundimonas sp. TaxID=213418 RepID=UPI0030ECC811|tara:strand:- start:613 stop:981 length:369 start_codon:yes stop_codon:yes gene_type:complete